MHCGEQLGVMLGAYLRLDENRGEIGKLMAFLGAFLAERKTTGDMLDLGQVLKNDSHYGEGRFEEKSETLKGCPLFLYMCLSELQSTSVDPGT